MTTLPRLAPSISLSVLLAGMLAVTFSPVRAEEQVKTVVVPFEVLKSKHIAVKVKINGKGPYRLIFDTGAPFTLVNTRVARDSGMVAKNAAPAWFALFNQMEPARMKSFELGDVKVENTSAAIMDHPTVEMISKVLGPIEGLIGFPFFARYKMTIDYQARQMTLAPSGYAAPDSTETLTAAVNAMMQDAKTPKVLAPRAQWGFLPAKDEKDDKPGTTVEEVMTGSAAAAAGLTKGDRLLSLDGRWTDSPTDVFHAASFIKSGSPAKAVVQRDGKEITLTITPRQGF